MSAVMKGTAIQRMLQQIVTLVFMVCRLWRPIPGGATAREHPAPNPRNGPFRPAFAGGVGKPASFLKNLLVFGELEVGAFYLHWAQRQSFFEVAFGMVCWAGWGHSESPANCDCSALFFFFYVHGGVVWGQVRGIIWAKRSKN